MPERVRRTVLGLAVAGLVAYAGAAATLYGLQRRVIFPGQAIDVRHHRPPALPGLEVLDIETPGGTTEAWYLPPLGAAGQPAPAMIFAHGNGEVIDWWADQFDDFRRWGLAILLVEYPGYGRSAGTPSEATIADTMARAYDQLAARPDIDRGRIVAYGHSLGGGAVAALSRQRPLAALILQSTFADLRRFARRLWMPGWLVRDPFDNMAAVRAFPGPVLVVHGRRDELIAVAQAEELAGAGRDVDLNLHDCGHGCWIPAVASDIRAFLQRKGIVAPAPPLRVPA